MPIVRFPSLPTWRRLALASWRPADDPTIYGFLEIDATNLLAFVQRQRLETGAPVTLTHVVGKAAALAFAAAPECNAAVTRRGLLRRESVDVFFSVALGDGKSLAGAKLVSADHKSVAEIAR
ncbi:MAG TPA: 2-oxo acid dehydrogenase subunit E2, partial [Polyangiaceae bacterium]|nr:2-oxo acid dehydrogenase subunit E2 [Polyangiaceae bacterium]